MRAFSCTECGTMLELEVCRKDEGLAKDRRASGPGLEAEHEKAAIDIDRLADRYRDRAPVARLATVRPTSSAVAPAADRRGSCLDHAGEAVAGRSDIVVSMKPGLISKAAILCSARRTPQSCVIIESADLERQ